ncbi:hypothetical protein Sps_03710 [Shewanella psychrophila]|uniref:DUF7933 domain-containing protein n=1 Tax=Shewanella psychrophila TaxID=225848 RepID=A0A1S6HTT8_9GAMM|nr:hypothetical protein [Shewanella psychrophila]AQS38828.1 hypothetical protein Sps_03710 [Shewanella psychrophila]
MKNTSKQKKCLLNAVYLVFYISLLLIAKVSHAAGTDLTLSGAFSTPTIASGHLSTLTYTLTNTSASSATDIAFTATLPANHLIAEQVGDLTTCLDGSYSAVAGASLFSASNYRLAAGASCILQFNVTATATGATLTSGLNSSLGAGTNISTTLTVDATLFTLGVSLASPVISVGAVNTINYAFTNTGSTIMSGTAAINLPSRIVIAPIANFSSDCGGVSLAEPAGANSISLWYNACFRSCLYCLY